MAATGSWHLGYPFNPPALRCVYTPKHSVYLSQSNCQSLNGCCSITIHAIDLPLVFLGVRIMNCQETKGQVNCMCGYGAAAIQTLAVGLFKTDHSVLAVC